MRTSEQNGLGNIFKQLSEGRTDQHREAIAGPITSGRVSAAVFLRKSINLLTTCDFPGVGGLDHLPPLDPPMTNTLHIDSNDMFNNNNLCLVTYRPNSGIEKRNVPV